MEKINDDHKKLKIHFKTMAAIIIRATLALVFFFAFSVRGELYHAADSITITGDSIRILQDKILVQENTLRTYGKMVRRIQHVNDSLEMIVRKNH